MADRSLNDHRHAVLVTASFSNRRRLRKRICPSSAIAATARIVECKGLVEARLDVNATNYWSGVLPYWVIVGSHTPYTVDSSVFQREDAAA